VIILGTSHIAAESIREIKAVFVDKKPDIICVELDPSRLYALMHNEKSRFSFSLIRRVGVAGTVFVLVGRVLQRKLGDVVGMTPGSDMKTAVELAQQSGKHLRLIDQHIEVTLRDFSHKFTLREKMRLFHDLFFPPKNAHMLALRHQDLRKVPHHILIEQALSFLSMRYPGLYDALIAKRNKHMARQLFYLNNQYRSKSILAVVGAGHVEGILAELARLERTIDVVHPPRKI
jgi:pheromone shutdown-related protein TraB